MQNPNSNSTYYNHYRIVYLVAVAAFAMGLSPKTYNCGMRMRRECRERYSLHRLQRNPLVSNPGTHHGTCVKHVPGCMSGSLTRSGGENVSGILGACPTRNFTYLARGPWMNSFRKTLVTLRIANICKTCYIAFILLHDRKTLAIYFVK